MSGHNLWAVLPLNSSANAAPVSTQALSVQCHYRTVTDVGRGNLEETGKRVFDIILVFLKWDELSYPQLWLLWGLSYTRIVMTEKNPRLRKKTKSLEVGACQGLNPLDLSRIPYWASKGKRSTIYHNLSTHHHVIMCTSFILINCTVFII